MLFFFFLNTHAIDYFSYRLCLSGIVTYVASAVPYNIIRVTLPDFSSERPKQEEQYRLNKTSIYMFAIVQTPGIDH